MLAHHRGVRAAVSPVHILQHPLAVAVREVDVNVRCFAPLFAQEALEQQPEFDRIDRRNAEHKTDGAVGRRAAPLAEHAVAARELHDVPDNQEIAGESEFRDQREFVGDLFVVLCRAAPSPPFARALLDELRQIFFAAHAVRQRKLRQCRFDIAQTKRALLGDRQRGLQSCFVSPPPAGHLFVPFEIPLGVRAKFCTHLVECGAVFECAEHVVGLATGGFEIVHVVGDDPREVECLRDVMEPRDERPFFGEGVIPTFDGDALLENIRECCRRVLGGGCFAAGEEAGDPAVAASGEGKEAGRVSG